MSEYYGELVVEQIRELAIIRRKHATKKFIESVGFFISSNFSESVSKKSEKIAETLLKLSPNTSNQKPKQELIELLEPSDSPELQAKLDRLLDVSRDAKKELLKKRSTTSYIASVIRPLFTDELARTVNDRGDLSLDRLQDKAKSLLEQNINFNKDFKKWAKEVYDLFEEVSLYDNESTKNRPYGTISFSSKRPYSHAWFNFVEIEKENIRKACEGEPNNFDDAVYFDEQDFKSSSNFKTIAKVAAVTAVSPVLGSLYIAIGGTNKFSKKWSFDNLKSSSLIDWVSLVDSLQNKNETVDTKINIVNDGEEEEINLSADSWSVNKIKLLRFLESYASNTTALSKQNPTLKHDLEQAIAKIKSGETL